MMRSALIQALAAISRFWPFGPKGRFLWLFEVALALAIASAISPIAIIAFRSIYRQRLQDLRSLQLQHLASLIWYEVLQSQFLQKEGIVWSGFDKRREIALAPKAVLIKKAPENIDCNFSLRFTRDKEMGRYSFKRLICAELTLWHEGEISANFQSKRWLILQPDTR